MDSKCQRAVGSLDAMALTLEGRVEEGTAEERARR